MLWAWNDKQPMNLLKNYRTHADEIAFSRNLTAFAISNGARIKVMDMDTGHTRVSFTDQEKEHILTPDFSRDGTFLILKAGGPTSVWDISTSRAKLIGSYPTQPIFSPNEQIFAVRSESDVSLRDFATGKEIGCLTKADDATISRKDVAPPFHVFGHEMPNPSNSTVEFSADSKLVCVSRLVRKEQIGSHARVYEVDPLKEIGVLESCRDVRFSPDGRNLIALTTEGQLKLWRITEIAAGAVQLPAASERQP